MTIFVDGSLFLICTTLCASAIGDAILSTTRYTHAKVILVTLCVLVIIGGSGLFVAINFGAIVPSPEMVMIESIIMLFVSFLTSSGCAIIAE